MDRNVPSTRSGRTLDDQQPPMVGDDGANVPEDGCGAVVVAVVDHTLEHVEVRAPLCGAVAKKSPALVSQRSARPAACAYGRPVRDRQRCRTGSRAGRGGRAALRQ